MSRTRHIVIKDNESQRAIINFPFEFLNIQLRIVKLFELYTKSLRKDKTEWIIFRWKSFKLIENHIHSMQYFRLVDRNYLVANWTVKFLVERNYSIPSLSWWNLRSWMRKIRFLIFFHMMSFKRIKTYNYI